MIQKTVFTRD